MGTEERTPDRLRVAVAAPLSEDDCARILALEPRIDLVVDQALLPPMRWPADFAGDPAWHRTPEQQRVYEAALDSADALYGIPDVDPVALARTVRANPRLRWVHTMAAGGGSQVKAARLTAEELDRVLFTTSAGVHGGPLAEFAVFGVLGGAKGLPRLMRGQRDHEWGGRWTMGQVSEHLVIGTGYGGSVTALRLAQAGVDVHMVEMGMAWDTPGSDGKIFANMTHPGPALVLAAHQTKQPLSNFLGFPIDKDIPRTPASSTPRSSRHHRLPGPRRRRRLAGQRRHGGHAQARELRRDPAVGQRRRDVQQVLPARQRRARRQQRRPGLVRDRRLLPVRPGRPKQAQRSGFPFVFVPNVYDWDYMKQEQANTVPKSALAGEILYGNNYGKKSLQKTYLAAAKATGRSDHLAAARVTSVPRRPAAATRSSSSSSTPPATPRPPRP
jgi:hypothetical protein